jgi:hypothetical protein
MLSLGQEMGVGVGGSSPLLFEALIRLGTRWDWALFSGKRVPYQIEEIVGGRLEFHITTRAA